LLMLAGAALAVILIIINLVMILRRRKERQIEEEQEELSFDMFIDRTVSNNEENKEDEVDLSEFDLKSNPKRKTIEKLAKERPEDFVKLLRSWMAED